MHTSAIHMADISVRDRIEERTNSNFPMRGPVSELAQRCVRSSAGAWLDRMRVCGCVPYLLSGLLLRLRLLLSVAALLRRPLVGGAGLLGRLALALRDRSRTTTAAAPALLLALRDEVAQRHIQRGRHDERGEGERERGRHYDQATPHAAGSDTTPGADTEHLSTTVIRIRTIVECCCCCRCGQRANEKTSEKKSPNFLLIIAQALKGEQATLARYHMYKDILCSHSATGCRSNNKQKHQAGFADFLITAFFRLTNNIVRLSPLAILLSDYLLRSAPLKI
jgi:hypothetical protein